MQFFSVYNTVKR